MRERERGEGEGPGVGDRAPAFSLEEVGGEGEGVRVRRLEDARGAIVLFFVREFT